MLGVSTTLLVDRARARRERIGKLDKDKREAYAELLAALTATDGDLQALALEHRAPVPRPVVVAAFNAHGLLARRYQIALVAPDAVAQAADEAYRTLRGIREAIIATEVDPSSRYEDDAPAAKAWGEVHPPYVTAIFALRDAMRADVQQR
ncbi:hypothetical protein D5S17_34095 [Pseudonocardiaceae bacterium YIM PH 21723]|nr:hypothetical protein D5S17_34095 [Pseudonocardiaceae bacterium YIM PH 21723]